MATKILKYLDRRAFVAGAVALLSLAGFACASKTGAHKMFGLIAKITCVEGGREDLINILLEGTSDMPGNVSYNIAEDQEDKNIIWITEVWDSQASQENSLKLDSVQNAIGRARPLIAGMSRIATTSPIVRTA